MQRVCKLIFEALAAKRPPAVGGASDLLQLQLAQFTLKRFAVTKLPFFGCAAQALVHLVRRYQAVLVAKCMKSIA